MRPFHVTGPSLNPRLLQDLVNSLARTKSALSPIEAIEMAVRAWMVAKEEAFLDSGMRTELAATADAGVQDLPHAPRQRTHLHAQSRPGGYQWKSLFLPHGTELRMRTEAGWFHAQVDGDVILHKGKAMSPRQFTVAATGEARNAWRDISIRRPGDDRWRSGAQLRRECGADEPATENISPMIAMREVAAAMEATLKTARGIIAEAKGFAEPKFDRRHTPARRNADIVEKISQLD